MNNRVTRQLTTVFLFAGGALLALPLAAQLAETGRDPYAACVAAETARQTGVTAEARARQKCRKLYPSGSTASPTLPGQQVDAIPVVVPTTPTTSPAVASSTPTAAASAPVASPMPAPTVPAGGHPLGGPPGLNK